MKGFSNLIWFKCGPTLGCWGTVTHWPAVETKLFAKKKKVPFNPRISFWDNIHKGFIQRLDSFFTGHSCWFPTRVWSASGNLSLSPDSNTAADVRSEEAACLFIGVIRGRSVRLRDWMLRLPSSPLSHTGHFLNLSLLTSHRADKWIDSIKIAEGIQLQDWKCLTFPLHRPTPPPSKSNWLE